MEWDGVKSLLKEKTIYLLVGAPGSGKTWITSQLGDKFNLIHHDGFNYLKNPDKDAYLKEILRIAPKSTKPVLIEAPFSVSSIKEPLEAAGYKVEPIYIIENEDVHSKRYIEREKKEGRWSEDNHKHLKGHITRTKTYLERAKAGNDFYGTSDQVLKHLKDLAVK
jgi:2-phosphoglycerate kinase